MTTVITVAARPTISETCEPQIVSESTDRPWESVPNQNFAEGGAKAGFCGWQIGDRSHLLARSGAKIATRTKNSMMASPATPILLLRYWRQTRRRESLRRLRAIHFALR